MGVTRRRLRLLVVLVPVIVGYGIITGPEAGMAAAGPTRSPSPALATEKLDLRLAREFRLRAELADKGATPPAAPVSSSLPWVTGNDGVGRVPCWVRLQPGAGVPGILRANGKSAAPRDVVPCRLTLDEIARLAENPSVILVRSATRTKPLLNLSTAEINLGRVRTGTPPDYQGYTGRGVIVGIVDTGIDLAHGDFRDASGTRILSLWDQTSLSGPAPAEFDYGREWSAAQINAGICNETDNEGHGTHVTGIAAGNGAGGSQPWTYVGLAPQAPIIFVKTTFWSDDIADGVQYIFNRAAALGMPAVVNLSLGYQQGPHDGTEDMESFMAGAAGPDRIVVGAAGNEQADSLHSEAALAPGDSARITLRVPHYTSGSRANDDYVDVDGYYPPAAAIGLRVKAPSSSSWVSLPAGTSRTEVDTPSGTVALERLADSGNLSIQIIDQDRGADLKGTWQFSLTNTSAPDAPAATVDLWMFESSIMGNAPDANPPAFVQGMTQRKLVCSPANSDSVIAVAAYVTRKNWTDINHQSHTYGGTIPITLGDLAYFSSHGPRRDGAMKPDVAAPGMGIGSALSANSSVEDPWKLEDGAHMISQGTSMAAPHVTGLVALMLESWPRVEGSSGLSVREALRRLQVSARRDSFARDVPNSAWGAGKIDALGAVEQDTPVFLSSVMVSREQDDVTLRWAVPLDLGSLLFDVIRSVDGEGEEVRGRAGPGPSYSFVDALPSGAGEALYWLAPVESRTAIGRLGPYASGPSAGGAALTFRMSPPAPNPSTGVLRWSLTLPRAGTAVCTVIDPAGRTVQAMRPGIVGPGQVEFFWDGRDSAGHEAGSGVFWIRAEWHGKVAGGKVLRLPQER